MFNYKPIAGAALLLATLAGGALAEVREHTFRMGFQTSLDTAFGRSAEHLVQKLDELSGGKMKMELYPQGQLGGDVQILSSVRAGIVDGISVSTALLTTVEKDFALFDLPFLVSSDEEAEALYQGAFGDHLAQKIEGQGLKIMYFSGSGFRNLTNNVHAVKTLDDVSGLKLRVLENPVYVETWKALGANPVPMPFPELYTALETGTVDGQENPYRAIYAARLFEVQEHLSMTRHVYFVGSLVFSKKVWDGLNEEEQAILDEAYAAAYEFYKGEYLKENEELSALLAEEMEVNELDDGAIDGFREATRPVFEKFGSQASAESYELLQAELDKLRQ